MRSARRVMSSRLPMGVATRYRQPRRGVGDTPALGLVFMTVGKESLARGACGWTPEAACYNRWFGEHAGGIAVRELQAADRENRERVRAVSEEVPALRRKSGADVYSAGHSVQRLGLVCERLCREEEHGE